MKKYLIIVAIICLAMAGQAQTTAVKAKRAELTALKLNCNFVPINPDTLVGKKNLISFAKDSTGQYVYYIKIEKSFYRINSITAQLEMNGEPYILIARDSIRVYEQNIIEPILTIK